MTPTHIEAFAGDTVLIDLSVTLDGVAVNVTGMTVRFSARRRTASVNSLSSETSPATAAVTITDAEAGEITIEIDGADTAALLGDYEWQAEIEDGAGAKSTVAHGTMTFLPSIV